MDTPAFRPLQPVATGTACTSCSLRELCLPAGLSANELAYLDGQLVAARRRVHRGSTLFQAGDHCQVLYAIWTGSFKTCIGARDGRCQVTGFQLPGDLLGLDGLATHRHEVDAEALEDAQVCVIPVESLETLSLEVGGLQQRLRRLMSREVVRQQAVMLLLGSMYAEERLASFLLDLATRMHERGFSRSALLLRMTREEIGSYLGLTLETVSRTLSKFQNEGLMFVRHRQIHITDPVGLRQVVDGVTA